MRWFIAGATSERPVVRERGLGDDVVGEAVREPRERVRRERRDDVAGRRAPGAGTGRSPPRGERPERLGGDEPLGAAGHEGSHLVSRADEQPDELARLVGGDPSGNAYRRGPWQALCRIAALIGTVARRYFDLVGVLDLAFGDFLEGHRQVVLGARLHERRGELVERALTELVVVVVDLPRPLRGNDHERVTAVDLLE